MELCGFQQNVQKEITYITKQIFSHKLLQLCLISIDWCCIFQFFIFQAVFVCSVFMFNPQKQVMRRNCALRMAVRLTLLKSVKHAVNSEW